MIENEAFTKKRYVIDTCVLINYLRDSDDSADANAILAISSGGGKMFYSIFSEVELWKHGGKREEIKKEIKSIRKLAESLQIEVLPCSPKAQVKALELIELYGSNIGKDPTIDCLIASTAILRKATFLTADTTWSDIGKKVKLVVKTPEEITLEDF